MSSHRVVEDGLDLEWLRRQAEVDPVRHAFAVWDLSEYADRVRFVMLRTEDGVEGYLLVWYGSPAYPVVHWVGASDGSPELAEVLPPRPFVAVVPPKGVADVERSRGPVRAHPLRVLRHGREDPLFASRVGAPRRLTFEDVPQLRTFASGSTEQVTSAYAGLDPARAYIAGAFRAGRLVAVARAQVQLRRVWILGGIYTGPENRGRGYGASVTAAVTRAAHAAGADAALYVRQDNLPAVRAYERVGYGPFEEKVWLDAGADVLP